MSARRSRQLAAVALRLIVAGLVTALGLSSATAVTIEPLPPPPDPPASQVFGDLGSTGAGPIDTGPVDRGPPTGFPPLAPPVYPRPFFGGRPDPWDTPSAGLPWVWQAFPEGLIWRSYLAGPKEPRFGLLITNQSGFGRMWDANIGARFSLIRYGTTTAYRPEGFEVDLEGAVQPRLQPDLDSSPLVSTDFRIGVPVTYCDGPWQFKTGYSHISSHLGDEYMILHPGVKRINYVRDSIMFAVGYFYTENLRLFAELDYAIGVSDGAEPGELQFGFDYSPAVRHGAPFLAAYGNLRQEVDYGGFFVVQTGWQWRGGAAMHTFRLGVEYLNGQSPQYEFFDTFEQHVGFGLWYDF